MGQNIRVRVRIEAGRDRSLVHKINEVLAVEGLSYTGATPVRHLVDVLANDVGTQNIESLVVGEPSGIKVAPYYGCQVLRPYPVFDDPERPQSMTPLLQALGVTVLDWDMGGACCGASLMATKREVALHSVAAILKAAQEADCIVTICPMCQMNLEAYQDEALKLLGRAGPVSVLYLTQLMGLAFGMSKKEVMLGKNMVVTNGFKEKIETLSPVGA